jgi:hypothetical protein
MTFQLPSVPVSIGGVLDSALRLFRSTYDRCWPLALLYILLTASFAVAELSILLPLRSMQPGASPTDIMQTMKMMLQALLSPVFIGAIVLLSLGSTVLYGALMLTQTAAAQGAPISLGKALAGGLWRLPAAVAAALLCAVVICAGTALFAVPGYYMVISQAPVGWFLFIPAMVFAIYLMGKLQLVYPALYVEKAGPLRAFGISWQLMRRRWWRGVIIVTVTFVIIYVISLAFNLVGLIGTQFVPVDPLPRAILQTLIGQIPYLVVMPVLIAVYLSIYHDFKLRSQGGDLAAQLGTVRQA